MTEIRLDSPSFHRNIEPITQKLQEILEDECKHVLEIGSGTGQHVDVFSSKFSTMMFQPTDYDSGNLASINAWSENNDNVAPAIQLDVMSLDWFDDDKPKFDALFCFNVIHITPWDVTKAIFRGANKFMNRRCQIIFYGPFKIGGKNTSKSNDEFENWLTEKHQTYGIRDIADVSSAAKENGFQLQNSFSMPANNFLNVFHRS